MPLGHWNLEWLDQNATRSYPFADFASRQDATATFTIPTDFLVELDIPIHAGTEATPDKVFLRVLLASPAGYSLTFAYAGADGYQDIGSVLITAASHRRNAVYTLSGLSPFDDSRGKVVVGDLQAISQQPAGAWEFTPDAAAVEPDCVRPILRGVQSLTAVDGIQRSLPLTGDVEFVAGANMRITAGVAADGSPKLVFSAISGEGLVQPCSCQDETRPCIKTINGIGPTDTGDFYVFGDDCIVVSGDEHAIRLTDRCSKPCCGCAELEAITSSLEQLNQQRAAFEAFVGQMMGVVGQMETVMADSQLS